MTMTLQLTSGRLAGAVDARDHKLAVVFRCQIEDEIVHVRYFKNSPSGGRYEATALLIVERGMEGTDAVDHPAGAEVIAI